MISLLVYTGLRRGELCGLEWQDIDLENKRIFIVRSSQHVGGEFITKSPKSRSGVRDFASSDTACQILKTYRSWQREHKLAMGDRWVETDNRLFTQWDGKPIHPDTVTGWFADFIRKTDLPYVTLHSLRHINATLMVASGADVRTVSKRLGHADTSITLNLYSHALKSKDNDAAEKLEDMLSISQKIS